MPFALTRVPIHHRWASQWMKWWVTDLLDSSIPINCLSGHESQASGNQAVRWNISQSNKPAHHCSIINQRILLLGQSHIKGCTAFIDTLCEFSMNRVHLSRIVFQLPWEHSPNSRLSSLKPYPYRLICPIYGKRHWTFWPALFLALFVQHSVPLEPWIPEIECHPSILQPWWGWRGEGNSYLANPLMKGSHQCEDDANSWRPTAPTHCTVKLHAGKPLRQL